MLRQSTVFRENSSLSVVKHGKSSYSLIFFKNRSRMITSYEMHRVYSSSFELFYIDAMITFDWSFWIFFYSRHVRFCIAIRCHLVSLRTSVQKPCYLLFTKKFEHACKTWQAPQRFETPKWHVSVQYIEIKSFSTLSLGNEVFLYFNTDILPTRKKRKCLKMHYQVLVWILWMLLFQMIFFY